MQDKKLDIKKAVHWLVQEGYISPVEANRTFESLSNFKSVIEHINEQSRQEGYEEFMRDAKHEADKARIRLQKGGMDILVPKSWGKAKQKAIAKEIFQAFDDLVYESVGDGQYEFNEQDADWEEDYRALKKRYNVTDSRLDYRPRKEKGEPNE